MSGAAIWLWDGRKVTLVDHVDTSLERIDFVSTRADQFTGSVYVGAGVRIERDEKRILQQVDSAILNRTIITGVISV